MTAEGPPECYWVANTSDWSLLHTFLYAVQQEESHEARFVSIDAFVFHFI